MRWADMDLLGHVNNVTYLEYVAEAREDLFQGTGVDPKAVTGHQVEFASPLVFRRQPVLVDTWVTEVGEDSVTLAHEIYDPPAEPRWRAHALPPGLERPGDVTLADWRTTSPRR